MLNLLEKLLLNGVYEVVHRDRNGKELSREVVENLVTNEGFNYLLNAALHGEAAISDWYFVPWKTNTAAAVADTYAVPVNTEAATTDINEANRQAWGEGAASGQSITNAVAARITAKGTVTIYGAGIVGGGNAASTISDTAGSGKLLSSKIFTTQKDLTVGETLDLTYTLSKT